MQHKDININLQDKQGRTALMQAVNHNSLYSVKRLVQMPGIDFNIITNQKTMSVNALLLALFKEKIKITKELLKHGASIKITKVVTMFTV